MGIKTMDFDDATFVNDVFVRGCHVLACGGGVLPDARAGIPPLSAKYGRAGLLERCLIFYAGDPGRPLPALPEGVWFAFRDIIYYLADAKTVEHLLAVHRKESPNYDPTRLPADFCNHTEITLLIATITQRLGLPLPDGIPPPTGNAEQAWLFPGGRMDE